MRATTSLNINILNIYHSKVVARNNTALVKPETKLPFCLGFVHKVFLDRMALQNDSVGLVLDLHLLVFGQ